MTEGSAPTPPTKPDTFGQVATSPAPTSDPGQMSVPNEGVPIEVSQSAMDCHSGCSIRDFRKRTGSGRSCLFKIQDL